MITSGLHPFGIELKAIDVTRLTADNCNPLIDLLGQHGVVVIREQNITDHQFVWFLSLLGPLTFTKGETAVAHCTELNLVSNVNRAVPPRSVFHTDTSYVARTPAFTALKPIDLPDAGGDTLFTNQYEAYDRLPTELKADLQSAEVLHVATGVHLAPDDESCHWHPLFRTHPVTGRKSLFLTTPERCKAIRNTTHSETHKLIETLYAHSTQSNFILRHRWSRGDLVLWDNRCTMHRADHSEVIGRRTMHRGLILDKQPLQTKTTTPFQSAGV